MENQSVISGNRFSLMLTTPVAHKVPGEQIVTGGDLTPGEGITSIISDGYYNGTRYVTNDKVILETRENTGYYKITANGRGSVNRAPVTKETTKEGFFFEEGASEEIPAASIESDNATKEYFIKKSTVSTETIAPTDRSQEITVSGGYCPTNRTVTVEAVTPAYPVTDVECINMPAYFYSANERDYDIKIVPSYSNSAGFVIEHQNATNGGVEHYKMKTTNTVATTTTVNEGVVTRGSVSWNMGWIDQGSIAPAAFKKAPTDGVDYVDISNTNEIPSLQEGDSLYIDAGYVDNLKISLAQLAPRAYDGSFDVTQGD